MKKSNKEKRFEILAVVLTGLLKFVLMDWLDLRLFYVVGACLFWFVYIYKKTRKDPEAFQKWGFQKAYLKQSLLFLLPFVLIVIAGIIVYGKTVNAQLLNWHVIPVLILYPAWGIIQQFLMIGLVAGNFMKLSDTKITESQVILFTSFLFALVHYPSLPLMGFAFILEIVFIKVFFKWPNIWSLGLYHGWIGGLFIFFVLERDLWSELWVIF